MKRNPVYGSVPRFLATVNIFYVHTNPEQAAIAQCDKHVVKMILESAQMLSTARRKLDGNRKSNDGLYKIAFVNHPSTIWVRESKEHYEWLYNHFVALGKEYEYRYEKTHKTIQTIGPQLATPPLRIENKGFSPPPQCMPDEYKQDDAVKAYRAYYKGEKSSLAKWTKRDPPDWW